MSKLYALIFGSLIAISISASAQKIGVGYYNLDGLYDTIPSALYRDEQFTPQGAMRWDTRRYKTKIERSAALIDSLSLPIIGLSGVESEAVVRDLLGACHGDYSYVYAPQSSLSGLGFALLYFGDRLFVDSTHSSRGVMRVEGSLCSGEPITIFLSRGGGKDVVDYLKNYPPTKSVVVLGSIGESQIRRLDLQSQMEGKGNYCASSDRWLFADRIAVSKGERILKSGAYIAPWLLNPYTYTPLPTFDSGQYIGGYSKYLPIFVYLL